MNPQTGFWITVVLGNIAWQALYFLILSLRPRIVDDETWELLCLFFFQMLPLTLLAEFLVFGRAPR
jgi:hypothetical protein